MDSCWHTNKKFNESPAINGMMGSHTYITYLVKNNLSDFQIGHIAHSCRLAASRCARTNTDPLGGNRSPSRLAAEPEGQVRELEAQETQPIASLALPAARTPS